MKVFPSARWVSAAALIYLALHLPFLAPAPEDVDSINFVLGLREFNVAKHQPHPPGSPVYIALGRMSLAAVRAVAPALERIRSETIALALWSAAAGAAAMVGAWALFSRIGQPGLAFRAACLLAASPLFWISGLRPMSDLPALALTLAAQAATNAPLAALLAALAAGIKIQTILLTAPVLLFAAIDQRWNLRMWTRVLGAGVAGVLVWLIPLLAASGGVGGFIEAIGAQAGQDLAGVDMLWTTPTPRRLAQSLYQTFVLPWSAVALAAIVGALAVSGGIVAAVRQRRALLMLMVAFGPYVLFHIVFQETVTVRYALPTVPAVAWLAASGLQLAGRLAVPAAAALTVAGVAIAMPTAVAYSREAHPAFRAIADMASAAASHPPAALFTHYGLLRPLQALPPQGVRVVVPQLHTEWTGLVDYWRAGGRETVWFLADPRRTDLALVDPHARTPMGYRWSIVDRPEISGVRPNAADWYRFEPPGWFAGEGWSLTPETGGLARARLRGPDLAPISAFVKGGRGPLHAVVGGGYIGPSVDSVRFVLAIDGVTAATWTLDPSVGSFLQFIDLPADVLPDAGSYAHLTIAAASEPGRAVPPVEIRQFDIQPAHQLIYGFGDGWHQLEYDPVTGRTWRWTSGRSTLRVSPPQRVRIVVRGESPLRYFADPPRVRLTANGREIASLRPASDFSWTVDVPADAVRDAAGAIVIETDREYLPAVAEGSLDARRLGLRLFDIALYPVSP